jgi:hypothetical protein
MTFFRWALEPQRPHELDAYASDHKKNGKCLTTIFVEPAIVNDPAAQTENLALRRAKDTQETDANHLCGRIV